MRITRLGVLAAAVAAIAIAPAVAFHDGGVAHCNGCHTMHNSQNGIGMNYAAGATAPGTGTDPGEGYVDLLLFNNKNDLCLRCHAGNNSYHVWADDPLNPGFEHGAGNFVFLEEDNLNDGHAGGAPVGCDLDFDNQTDCEGNGGIWDDTLANPIPGYAAGHTLVSGIKGTAVDPVLGTGPGGDFTSLGLSCVSCHDPHGNDSFRLTYRSGQTASDPFQDTDYTATIDAEGINLFFLFGGDPTETNTNHNAYRAGYSAWCGTCHGLFHQGSGADIHPSGETLGGIAAVYNSYDGTQDCIDNEPNGGPCGTGDFLTAYLAAVPIERGAAAAINSTEGAIAGDRVACVSCHRAHASSAPDAGRWDFNVTGLREDGVESGSYAIPNPYNDPVQRSLCNKCHSKDEFDNPHDFTPDP